MTNELTPQQRWQKFRDERLPTLTRRQQRFIIMATVAGFVVFTVTLLPFVLPLRGPQTHNPRTLADSDGDFVTIDNQQVYYQHRATPGDTVLLIHGQGGSTLTWRDTLSTLHDAEYNVYAIDLPGAGLSDKGLDIDYSHPAIADLIIHFMDAQDIEHAHVVAHAFSGNIAIMVAQLHPERVDSLSLVAPTIITWSPPQIPPSVLNLPFVERWTRVLTQFVVPDSVGELLRSATKIDEVVTDDLIKDYSRVLYTEGWDFTAIGMARDSHLNALPQPLSTLQTPVLLLWGTDDGWAPPEQANELVDQLPEVHRVDFEGVGHLPMHEVPDNFNAALINFLNNE